MAIKEVSSSPKPQSRVNSMLSIWYGIIIGALQAYIIVQCMRKFVWFAELTWPYQKTPFLELNAYIALTGVAILMLPFFLAASFLQIGNTGNDNRLLGKDLNSKDEWATFLLPNMLYHGSKGFFRTIWVHSGPTSSFIHVISSFCLLLPQTIMEAVLLKYGHLSKDVIWQSDMDILLQQNDRDAVLQILNSVDTDSGKIVGTSLMDYSSSHMRIEYLNYGMAIVIFSLRYAGVFWHTNKTFSILFSLQLLVNSVHSLISFSTFSILYKLHVLGSLNILQKNLPFLLNSHVTLLLYIISVTILLLSSSVLYHYGYQKISSFVEDKTRTQHVTNPQERYGTGWAYFPHCSALAVLLALAAAQSPLVHDATLVYRLVLDNCMLAYVVSAAVHLLLWILLWLSLTTKSSWTFDVNINIGRLRVKELDSLKLAAEISLGDPSDVSSPLTPLHSSMLILNDGQAFAVSDVCAKRTILELLLQNAVLKSDSDERIYWPRPQDRPTQASMGTEDQPWLKENRESGLRNKVTFYDDLASQRKYASVPLSRGGALKRSFRDKTYSEIINQEDDGDYALLRRGKSCMKSPITVENKSDNVEEIRNSAMPPPNCQLIPVPCCNNAPLNLVRRETSVAQGTPRSVLSTDSGYAAEIAGRSESRSTSGSSDSSSSGVHSGSGYTGTSSSRPQSDDCYCEAPQCYLEHSTYGLIRKDSIRSTVHPIYERTPVKSTQHQNSIYETRQMIENPYGENPNKKPMCQNESSKISVLNPLDSPPYLPTEQQQHSASVSGPASTPKYNNINTANELNEMKSLSRKSSIRRSMSSANPDDSLIQSTAYGRCTKLGSYADPLPIPIPPPLPPLSCSRMMVSNEFRASPNPNLSHSVTYVSPYGSNARHTFPNHVLQSPNVTPQPMQDNNCT